MRGGYSREILLALGRTRTRTLDLAELLTSVVKAASAGEQFKSSSQQRRFLQGIYYLAKKNFVKLGSKNNGQVVSLTTSGLERLKKASPDTIRIARPKLWDRRWRVIAFDIPLTKKNLADSFRKKLKNLDFMKLQRSLWVYPFPCESEVVELSRFYGLDSCVTVMEVGKISDDHKLKAAFGLR